MSAYVQTPGRVLPRSLVALRVLLYVGGVIGVLAAVGYLVSEGVSGETVGRAVWSVWPSVLAIVCARRLAGGGRRWFWTIAVVGAFWVLMALANLGRGDPRGLTSLVIPIVALVLLTRRTARDYLLHG